MFDFTKNYETNSILNEGIYDVQIDKVEFKTSKTNNEYLSVQVSTKENKKIFAQFNIGHDKENVRNIAMAGLKELVTACNYDVSKLAQVSKQSLIEMLEEQLVKCQVVIDRQEGFQDKNKIKRFNKKNNIFYPRSLS
jgi:hypothetical protein